MFLQKMHHSQCVLCQTLEIQCFRNRFYFLLSGWKDHLIWWFHWKQLLLGPMTETSHRTGWSADATLRLLLNRWSVKISSNTPTILTEIRGFYSVLTGKCWENTFIVMMLLSKFLPIHQSSHHSTWHHWTLKLAHSGGSVWLSPTSPGNWSRTTFCSAVR
jgi:hypothetical protein